jgi:hypothetical protein
MRAVSLPALVIAALLVLLVGHQGTQPESRGYSGLLAATVAVGVLGLGILVDVATPAPWIPVGVQQSHDAARDRAAGAQVMR